MNQDSTPLPLEQHSIDAAVTRIIRAKLGAGIPLTLPIVSNSMAPLLVRGDTIEVVSLESHTPAPGEVVIFRARGKFFVHRLIRMETDTCLTRGDTRAAPDYPIPTVWIVGTLRARIRNGERLDFRATLLSPESPRIQQREWIRRLRLRSFHLLTDTVVRACNAPLIRSCALQRYRSIVALLPGRLDNDARYSLYIKGSVALGEIEPGVSDIDPLLVHSDVEPGRVPRLHRDLSAALSSGILHRRLIGGMFICSERFFRFYLSYGGIRALGSREWMHLAGPERRTGAHRVQEAGLLHSLFREFFGSYAGAYKELCSFVAKPRISVWLRLERRLLDVVAFAACLSNPASAWSDYTASRIEKFNAFGNERLSSAAVSLQANLRQRRTPSPQGAVSSFVATSTAAIEAVLESSFCRPFFEASPQVPQNGWSHLWAESFLLRALPQESWQAELEKHFETPGCMWLSPPLPKRLSDCAPFIRPLGAALLGAQFPEHRLDLIRCECADYGALFAASFRPSLSSQFVRFGAYFALLESVLLEPNVDPEKLFDSSRIDQKLREVLSPNLERLKENKNFGGWVEIEKLAPLFLQAQERCILLLQTAEQA